MSLIIDRKLGKQQHNTAHACGVALWCAVPAFVPAFVNKRGNARVELNWSASVERWQRQKWRAKPQEQPQEPSSSSRSPIFFFVSKRKVESTIFKIFCGHRDGGLQVATRLPVGVGVAAGGSLCVWGGLGLWPPRLHRDSRRLAAYLEPYSEKVNKNPNFKKKGPTEMEDSTIFGNEGGFQDIPRRVRSALRPA